MNVSKATDLLIKHGHKLTMDEVNDCLDLIRTAIKNENRVARKRALAKPDPKRVAIERSKRARGMSYDVELLEAAGV